MSYLRHSYLLFSLAVISGIFIFRQLSGNIKEKISVLSLPILISGIVFLLIFAFVIFSGKENFSKNRFSFYILTVFLVLLMLLSFLSAGRSFSSKLFNHKDICELINKDSLREACSIEISGRVASHPRAGTGNYYFNLDNSTIIFNDRLSDNRHYLENINDIFISMASGGNKKPAVMRDDIIKISVEDIKKYVGKKGEKLLVFCTEKAEKEKASSFLHKFYTVRQKVFFFLSEKFRECFSYRNYTFASAVLLGNQEELSQALRESFTKSGLYHMLAISGLHLSILFSIISFFLSRADYLKSARFRNTANLLCFLLLLAFNILVGLKAAMMRASFFFIIYSVSRNFGKYNHSQNVLCMTLIAMLLINPEFLSDAGFILSFAATAGIIIVSPVIKKIFFLFSEGRHLTGNYFVKILILNTSVNIFILPLSFYYFRGYYVLSFLSNMVCSPVFYLILLLLFAGSVLALFLPATGYIFLKPASLLISLIINLSNFFSESSFGYIKTKFFNRPLNIFIYYMLLFMLLLSANYFLSFKYKMKEKNVV